MDKQKLKDIIVRGEKERSVLRSQYIKIVSKFLEEQWKKENKYLTINRRGGTGKDVGDAIVRRNFCATLTNRFRIWVLKNQKEHKIDVLPKKAERIIENELRKSLLSKLQDKTKEEFNEQKNNRNRNDNVNNFKHRTG